MAVLQRLAQRWIHGGGEMFETKAKNLTSESHSIHGRDFETQACQFGQHPRTLHT